jgi:hypothetical protein
MGGIIPQKCDAEDPVLREPSGGSTENSRKILSRISCIYIMANERWLKFQTLPTYDLVRMKLLWLYVKNILTTVFKSNKLIKGPEIIYFWR